jgi:death-on-curing protein
VTTPNWVWVDRAVLLAVHDEQLLEHGGAQGTRDLGLFESAIARPQQLAHYQAPDVADLAAAHAFAIARDHPFVDGNERTAFVAAALLLALNGLDLRADDGACVVTMLAVAAGRMDEATFARWLREHSAPR